MLGERYGRVAVVLHWLVGGALLAQLAFGFLLDEIAPRGTPSRSDVINLHKSIGVALGLLIVVRIVWRLTHAPRPWDRDWPLLVQRAATFGHAALYASMLVMPLSGYLASNVNGRGVHLFGYALAPWGPALPRTYDVLVAVHDWTAIVFCALIAGHVVAAFYHLSPATSRAAWMRGVSATPCGSLQPRDRWRRRAPVAGIQLASQAPTISRSIRCPSWQHSSPPSNRSHPLTCCTRQPDKPKR